MDFRLIWRMVTFTLKAYNFTYLMHVDLDMDFRLMWKEVSLSLQAYNSIYVF